MPDAVAVENTSPPKPNIVKRLLNRGGQSEKAGNWRGGLLTTERTTPVEMGVKSQQEFIQLIFDRYETMTMEYKEPKPGEMRAGRQEMDDWSEWIMKMIAKENGFTEFDESSEAMTIQNMRRFMRTKPMQLDVLSDDTRECAYFLVRATTDEMCAALGVTPRDIASRFELKVPSYIIDAQGNRRPPTPAEARNMKLGLAADSWVNLQLTRLKERTQSSDKLLNLTKILHPEIPKGELWKQWKAQQRNKLVTAYDPLSHGYESAYMQQMMGTEPMTDEVRVQYLSKLAQMDDLRRAFLEADTGVSVHDNVWTAVDRFDTPTQPGKTLSNSLSHLENAYVNEVQAVLRDRFNNSEYGTLTREQQTEVRLEATRRAMADRGREHALAILEKSGSYGFRDDEVTEARGNLTKIEPAEVSTKYDDEVKTLEDRYTALKATQTDYLAKQRAKLEADAKRAKDEAIKNQNIDEYDARLKAEIAERDRLIAAKSSAKVLKPTYDNIDRVKSLLEGAKTELQNILDTQKNAEEALTRAQLALTDQLNLFTDPADKTRVATVYQKDPVTGVITVKNVELDGFVGSINTRLSETKKLQEKEVTSQKELRKDAKTAGAEVLDVIAHKRDEVIAAFCTGKVKMGDVKDWEDFVERLGLTNEHVLPPDRLVKLLITHLELTDMDPNEVAAVADTHQIPKEFEAQWKQVMDAFWRTDEYARAKVVLEIYADRFKAIKEKGDPFADAIRYRRPEKQTEFVIRETRRELVQDSMERDGIYEGVNAIVTQHADRLIVAKDGKLLLHRMTEAQDGQRNLVEIGEMGLGRNATTGDIEVVNPGTPEMQRIRSELELAMGGEAFNSELLAGVLGGTTQVIGNDRQPRTFMHGIDADGHHVINVISGPEFNQAGHEIPLAEFQIDVIGTFLSKKGRQFLWEAAERSKSLSEQNKQKHHLEMDEAAGKSVLNAREMTSEYKSGADEFRYTLDLSQSSGVTMKREKWDPVNNKWNAEQIGGKNMVDLDQFSALPLTDVPEGEQRLIPAEAFNLLVGMKPEDRKKLGFQPVPVDIQADALEPTRSGRISAGVDGNGNLVAYYPDGSTMLLTDLLNTVVYLNNAHNYHEAPANPAAVMTHDYLKLQSAIGTEFLKALNRRKATTP